MAEQDFVTLGTEAEKKSDLRIRLLKDEIAAQANTFDQIDSKTGVALGFTFVVVGQILASVFRIATDQSHLRSSHPALTTTAFLIANGLAISAIFCGIIARWPRDFHHAVEFNAQELEGSYETMIQGALDALGRATSDNQTAIASKGFWALATYLLVAAALVGYLGLTVILYTFSIPILSQKPEPVVATIQVPRNADFQMGEVRGAKSTNSSALESHVPLPSRGGLQRPTGSGRHGAVSPHHESEIERKVKAIVVEQLQVDASEVTPDASFKHDLGADDLDVTELVMQLEEAFNLEISDEDSKRLTTVKDAVKYVEQHVNRPAEK